MSQSQVSKSKQTNKQVKEDKERELYLTGSLGALELATGPPPPPLVGWTNLVRTSLDSASKQSEERKTTTHTSQKTCRLSSFFPFPSHKHTPTDTSSEEGNRRTSLFSRSSLPLSERVRKNLHACARRHGHA